MNINDAKRLIKRIILSNLVSEKKDLAITPLVSGKHGIGKSQMIKSIAKDLNGVCITIEGGTLKEGEITGLPYQYKDDNGNIKFRFLPYYAVERIQNEEKRLYELLKKEDESFNFLDGDENRYAINNLKPLEKIELIKNGTVKPVIIFIDEINRTENTVYKELMNILLTRSVNGYNFPWWVFFVGAMNPSTQNSIYATNEMDPAQLDRFLKLKVKEDAGQWIKYGEEHNVSPSILDFIRENKKCLSTDDKDLEDEEKPTPSPRGWDMVDTLLKSEPLLRCFFTELENESSKVEKDMKKLVEAKLGATVATLYFSSLAIKTKKINVEDIFNDDENLTGLEKDIINLSSVKKVDLCNKLIEYLKNEIEFMMLDRNKYEIQKKQLAKFISILDSSSKLLFAQNIVNEKTSSDVNLIDYLYDIFETDLIEMLDLSEKTKKLIEGAR